MSKDTQNEFYGKNRKAYKSIKETEGNKVMGGRAEFFHILHKQQVQGGTKNL